MNNAEILKELKKREFIQAKIRLQLPKLSNNQLELIMNMSCSLEYDMEQKEKDRAVYQELINKSTPAY